MYYVFGYRKKVIAGNIYKSFSNKSEKEKKRIVKDFYKHFCDLIVESIKNFTISEKQARKRFVIENPEVMNKYYDQGRSVVNIGGHYGNWELLAVSVDMQLKHKHAGIYKPLSNAFFEGKMRSSRSKFGLVMVPMKQTKEYMFKEHEEPNSFIFGADQWPSKTKTAYWTTFLGRDTPFHFGAEKYAKDGNFPVVYGEIIKVKRGHYKGIYHNITDDPNSLEQGEIIERFKNLLEHTIMNNNHAHWLWSHKRWKRTKEEVFKED